MLFSYNTIQKYFKNPELLPDSKKLEEILTLHAFEVDALYLNDNDKNDYIFDIKITPDRASYAYGLRFIAVELSLIIKELELHEAYKNILKPFDKYNTFYKNIEINSELINLENEFYNQNKKVPIYSLTKIKNIENTDSPDFVISWLKSLNMNSHGLVVDLTNIIMLDIGNPLHVFDADKVNGNIYVTESVEGEKANILGNKTIDLEPGTLIIKDDKNILAIAGVKGCLSAEVDKNTKNIILESANFDRIKVRKSSRLYNLLNDSSKRFEQGIDTERCLFAIDAYIHLLKHYQKNIIIENTQISEDVFVNDSYRNFAYDLDKVITIIGQNSIENLNEKLNHFLNYTLTKAGVINKGNTLYIPSYRLDLNDEADIADEFLRNISFNNLNVNKNIFVNNDLNINNIPDIEKKYFILQNTFSNLNFYELILHTLVDNKNDKDAIKLANSLNADRNSLRSNLNQNLLNSLNFNVKNIDIVAKNKDENIIKFFELGNVFNSDKTDIVENMHFAFGISMQKWPKGKNAKNYIENICTTLNIEINKGKIMESLDKNSATIEFDINNILNDINLNQKYIEILNMINKISSNIIIKNDNVQYKPLSIYPAMIRDIAFFVNDEIGLNNANIDTIIQEISEKYEIIVNTYNFDIFKKDNNTSYGYRFAFQSQNKTLTEDEVSNIISNIGNNLIQKGFILR